MTQPGAESWVDVPTGGTVVNPGSTERNLTGSWRTKRPVIDFDACSHCMICWVMCPDSCFATAKGTLVSVDLDHCKGCGICASECPRKCIEMVAEGRD
ncbi:MAG: 4Fe-4S binding protein [Chloroflexi bacterium]|nr:4Fe-4S binding protein [Chloroflexota bacterium]